MKKRLLQSIAIGATALIGITLTGCQDEDFGVTVQQMENDAFKASGTFDFAMSKDITIDLDFERPGANNPVWLYTEYPFDEEGELKQGFEPDYAFFLTDGKYKGACHLPTAVKKVFFITGGIGLPGMVTASVVDGALVFNNNVTRSITTTVINDTYGHLDVLADFDKGDWTSFDGSNTETITTEFVTFINSKQTGSHGTVPLTFADDKTWTGYLQQNGASVPSGNKRIFEITPSKTGIMKVYVSNPSSNVRTVYLSTTLGETNDYKVVLDPSVNGNDILKVNVTSGTTYYMWADNGMKYHGITLFWESDSEKSYLTAEDYTMTEAWNSDFVLYQNPSFKGTDVDHNFYNKLYMLYPWSATGKPLVSAASSSSTRYEGTEYHYSLYFDENGTRQGTGIDFENCEPKKYYVNTDVDKVYATIGDVEIKGYLQFNHKKDAEKADDFDDIITIDDLTAGTIKYYLYREGSAISKFKCYFDEISSEDNLESLGNNVYTGEHTFTELTEGSHTIQHRDGNNYNILKIEYTSYDREKSEIIFQNGMNKSGSQGIFSYTTVNGVKSEKVKELASATYNATTYTYGLQLSSRPSDKPTDYEQIKFTVPGGTRAKLTVVFTDNTIGSVKINDSDNYDGTNNIVTVYLDAPTADVEYILSKGNKGTRTVYYVGVDYDDIYETVNTTQYVKAYNNISSDELTAIQNRLTNTLWRGSGSKANAKAQYGDDFNKMYTSADQSKNNITVNSPTELYVTFQAEYNMTSANTFGYYYYDGNAPLPTTPNNLKKFIVFPNCTSDVYATGRKYKYKEKDSESNTYYQYEDGNENFVPLHPGDQVQLMYYDETSHQFTTTFPAGTIVGWFVVYNGFDAWSLNGEHNGQILSGKVRLGYSNNDFDGRIQPDTKIYYSDPIFNTDVQARCIQFTDKETGAISLCFEDSYPTTDGHSGTQDWTYDDLIVTLSATKKGDIDNNSGNETGDDDETYVSFRESGTYVFEDIWDGSQTDFDMNDVALTYSRLYSIASNTNKIHQVTERYTVLNDGATYNDAFVVRLPYTKNQLAKIAYKLTHSDGTAVDNGSGEITDFTVSTPQSSWTNDHPCIEIDGDKVDLVLFNDINTIEIGLMIDLEITFTDDLETTTVGEAQNGSVSTMTSNYTKAHYDPFLVVANYTGNDGRCEIHLPGKNTTTLGIVPGGEGNSRNNRWYIANNKFGITLNSMPFALDIPITDFKGCREGVVITSVYTQFAEWATSVGGTTNSDWYLHPETGTAWEPKR